MDELIQAVTQSNSNEFGVSETKNLMLYYCKAETFFNIVTKKELWLCDTKNMNDPNEARLLLTDFDRYLIEAAEKFDCKKIIYTAPNHKSQGINAVIDLFNLIKQKETNIVSEHVDSFVICLSEKGDDLNMFRNYSKDASGYCIGIKKENWVLMDKKNNSKWYSFKPVIYLSKEELKELKTEYAKKLLKKLLTGQNV